MGRGYINCTGPDCPLCKAAHKAEAKYRINVTDVTTGESKAMSFSFRAYWNLLMVLGYWDKVENAYPQGAD